MALRIAVILYRVIVVVALLLPATAALAADGTVPQPTILVINSYHPGYTWSDEEQAAVLAKLTGAMPEATILVEYLDTKHYPDERHYPELLSLFRHKLAGHDLRLVVTLDDPALVFLHKFRRELFAGVPVVFAGVNGFEPGLLHGDSLITGVSEALDPAGSIRLMLQLQPDLKEILVINDSTRTGEGSRRLLLAAWPEFAGRLQLRFAPDTTAADAAAALAAMPEGEAGLLLTFGSDRYGHAYSSAELVPLLTAASRVPLYGVHDNRLGHGVVGGMLLEATAHGHRAAELALRVLRGEPAGSIPVDITATATPMFDDRFLLRYGLDRNKLPAGCLIINQQRSVWREHPREITALLLVLLMLTVLVLLLTFNVMRRRRAESELRSLDQMKTNLLANVSHELRTPLVAIRGYSELIGEGLSGPINPTQHEQLAVVIRNIDRLLEMIDNLLDFSKLEIGVFKLNRQRCDLRDLARDAVANHLPRARRAHVNLLTELPPTPMPLLVDQAKIMQVLNNLIDNAIKFTPADGRITVAVTGNSAGVQLSVSDTGIGLTTAAQKRVFDRFYQVDSGPTRRRGGTGLGLSIVLEIARLHGGTARVVSMPGAGTTIIIDLPRDA